MTDPHSGPARWETLGTSRVATTRVFDVLSVKMRHPVRGTERDFTVIDAPDWCNVIALTPDGRLVLVRQFRYGSNAFSLEIPGGVIDRGEDPVAAGVRELREETGFVGTGARLLASVRPNPAIQNNRCHFIFIDGAVPSAATEWDHDEEIEISTLPVDEVFAKTRAGEITHSLVVAGLMHFEAVWRARTGRGI